MDLKQIQGLEIAKSDYENTMQTSIFEWPNLKTVYEYKDHLLTGNFLDIKEKSINHPHFNEVKPGNRFAYEYIEHPQNEDEIDSFCNKVLWDFRHSKAIHSDFSGVINYSKHLPEFLNVISELVNKIDESKYKDLNVIPTDIDFIDIDKKLDFYYFPNDAQFEPVSLIETTE